MKTNDKILKGQEAEIIKGLMDGVDSGLIEQSEDKKSFRLTKKGTDDAEKLLYTSSAALLLWVKLIIKEFSNIDGEFGTVLDKLYGTLDKNLVIKIKNSEAGMLLEKKRTNKIGEIIDELNEIEL